MKELVIDRKKWARGGNGGPACLLNGNGNMCCLGFLAKACGASNAQIDGVGMPSETTTGDSQRKPLVSLCYWSNLANVAWPEKLFPIEFDISELNDTIPLSDEERERQLKPLFRRIGYTLRFE